MTPGKAQSVTPFCLHFLVRIADQAAGLIYRKEITLKTQRRGRSRLIRTGRILSEDVDGFGTDMTSFARRTVLSSAC